MPLSAVKLQYFKSDVNRCEQGDILRDVTLIEWADVEQDHAINVIERILQYCVIVSQECDLEHDFNNRSKIDSLTKDKYLQSILLCPAYPVESFRTGEHLKSMGMKMERINSDNWKSLKQNNLARYHYLPAHADFQVPDLVVDFKHYITVPRDVIYRPEFTECYLATIEIMYRDSLSGRFAQYLSRIGLPEPNST